MKANDFPIFLHVCTLCSFSEREKSIVSYSHEKHENERDDDGFGE